MNETERVVAMLEAVNLGMPSRAAQVIRTLAEENAIMKSTIERVKRHLDFASGCKFNPEPRALMVYFDDMAEQQNRLEKPCLPTA